MLYALLCYGSEDEVAARSREQEQAVLSRCADAADRMENFGARGPALRLMPTTTAITLRPGAEPKVLDGPFDETREQLLGLWLLDCPTLNDAMAAARLLAEARGMDAGSLEVRPVATFER
ncbi:MAG: YciI family protein [Rhizobiaceae bacterium]